ncbi:DUF3108 domain-containing protein [Luteimonas kalidii]|uniref:DUF3108 domain-containing protein n=1 Tax=Luteimonas kalidii TaxID=3042025 RepID=UPI003CE50539
MATRPIVVLLLVTALAASPGGQSRAQSDAPRPVTPDPAVEQVPPTDIAEPRALQPFVATYEAWYEGKHAGSATMRLVRDDGASRWRVDLGVRGDRGFAGIFNLNIEQSTVFDVAGDGDVYRPLSQATTRKAALFFNRRTTGTYDWHTNTARWTGDVSKARRVPVPIAHGDMSGLLINLAVIRDAEPGASLRYRFVDSGRARDYEYRVSAAAESVTVAELSYQALRVERTNGGNDEMILWVADGVPTPVRILQREDGEDAIDLRLVEYRAAQ